MNGTVLQVFDARGCKWVAKYQSSAQQNPFDPGKWFGCLVRETVPPEALGGLHTNPIHVYHVVNPDNTVKSSTDFEEMYAYWKRYAERM